jgi:hypothetical protein
VIRHGRPGANANMRSRHVWNDHRHAEWALVRRLVGGHGRYGAIVELVWSNVGVRVEFGLRVCWRTQGRAHARDKQNDRSPRLESHLG